MPLTQFEVTNNRPNQGTVGANFAGVHHPKDRKNLFPFFVDPARFVELWLGNIIEKT
jgi:hypothetical protein